MFKKITGLLALLAVATLAKAQLNQSSLYSDFWHMQAAEMAPSQLGMDSYDRFFVQLPSYSFNFSQNLTDQKFVIDALQATDMQPYYDEFIDELPDVINVSSTFTMNAFKVGYRHLNVDGKEVFSVSLGHRETVTQNLMLDGDWLRLATQGNAQWLGSTVDFGNAGYNMLWMREMTLGFAAPIPKIDIDLLGKPLTFRAGVNLRFLTGIAAVYTEKAKAEITFSQDEAEHPDEIVLDYAYKAHAAIAVRDPEVKDLFTDSTEPVDYLEDRQDIIEEELRSGDGIGDGLALDLGLQANWGDRAYFSASLTGLGAINFDQTENNFSYADEGTMNFKGADMKIIDFENIDQELEDQFTAYGNNFEEYTYTREAFNMPVPTQLMLHGSYGFFPRTRTVKGKAKTANSPTEPAIASGPYEKASYNYYRDRVYVSYLQGFDHYLYASPVPYMSLGYTHNFWGHLELGGSMAFGGNAGFTMGPFVNYRVGFFRMGLGFNNMTPAFYSAQARGTDLNFNLGLAF